MLVLNPKLPLNNFLKKDKLINKNLLMFIKNTRHLCDGSKHII